MARCPREHKSKILTYNRWCALPPKKALAAHFPYSLPKYTFLDLPRMSFTVLPVSDCVSTPFALRPQHGTPPPPLCDLCEADDDVQDEQQTCNLNQDEQHAIFHCTHPHTVSLRRRFKSLFSEARAQDVCTFFLVNFMSELMDYCCLAWTSHRPYLTTGLSGTVWLKVLPCKSISVM